MERLVKQKLERLKVGLISPILANVYLHYVLDVWFEENIKTMNNNSVLIRYCDDFIACFSSRKEAFYFYNSIEERLSQFSLKLQQDKTRIIKFDINDNTSGSFNFLGFHIYCNNKKVNYVTTPEKTDKKCNEITEIITKAIEECIHNLVKTLNQYLMGNYNYYGIATNKDFVYNLYTHTVNELQTKFGCNSTLIKSIIDTTLEDYTIKKPTKLIDL